MSKLRTWPGVREYVKLWRVLSTHARRLKETSPTLVVYPDDDEAREALADKANEPVTVPVLGGSRRVGQPRARAGVGARDAVVAVPETTEHVLEVAAAGKLGRYVELAILEFPHLNGGASSNTGDVAGGLAINDDNAFDAGELCEPGVI